ncbi:MAG: SDR family oxidoreductase [Desulfobulbaceae bacterium]|nr:SDR family oxidoreductase [Desulfobulbaceae bacterium]HIJ79505.1 SDR family oxidoreductase [Deltaproteobacteria bacterium]
MAQNTLSVKDKVVLVTGAFGLIGKEVCRSYLQHQAKVVLAGHNPGQLAAIKAEFEADFNPEHFLVCELDVTNRESIACSMAATLSKFGQLDVLVNNAAIDAKFDKAHKDKIISSRFEDYPIEVVRQSVEVNLIGAVQVAQAACRQMLKQGFGNIINVASSYSLISPNQQLYDFGEEPVTFKPVDYVVSKSFMPNFTRYLATFYAKDNIRCNAIAPHGIFNDHDEKFLENFAKLSPIGRMCDKSEICGPFVFLASDASSYMTGSVLVVDGGWTAW